MYVVLKMSEEKKWYTVQLRQFGNTFVSFTVCYVFEINSRTF